MDKDILCIDEVEPPSSLSIEKDKSFKFRNKFYKNSTTKEWNNWHWQLQNRITSIYQLGQIISLSDRERDSITYYNGYLPLSITPYYASLIDPTDYTQPLRRTVVPEISENIISYGEETDPLSEEKDSPVPSIVHRYPDRALFLVTDFCSTYCRYCTRSRMVGRSSHVRFNEKNWEKAIQYIERTSAIRDVLISGGDPLTLADEKLKWLLSRLRKISHVEILRIGTKAPVVLPQRITSSFVKMLKHFHPLWMSIHFTHPDELTPEVALACERLADAGIPLGSQTVLLSGINDSIDTLKRLFHGLLRIRVRPYYLYQCDPIPGSAHFRTSVEKGIEIMQGLRGHTTGYAVPTYVIDAPGGGGKISIYPETIVGYEDNDLILKNYKGQIYRYPLIKEQHESLLTLVEV